MAKLESSVLPASLAPHSDLDLSRAASVSQLDLHPERASIPVWACSERIQVRRLHTIRVPADRLFLLAAVFLVGCEKPPEGGGRTVGDLARARAEYRALGEARLEVAAKAKTKEDWNRLWKEPAHGFPFSWGTCWNHCVQYTVEDYAAEVGFFIDVLGFPVNTLGPEFTMFKGPDSEFFFAVAPVSEERSATPPDTIELMFMVNDILATAKDLESRGIVFEQKPQPYGDEGSPMYTGHFRTPNRLRVVLWGFAQTASD